MQPDTDPAVDDPSVVDFILRRARDIELVHVYPAGAATKGLRRQGDGRDRPDARGRLRLRHRRRPADRRFQGDAAAAGLRRRPRRAGRAPARPTPGSPPARRPPRASSPAAWACPPRRPRPRRSCSSATWRWSSSPARGCWSTRSAPPRRWRAWRAPRPRGLPILATASINHLTFNELDIGDYRTFWKLEPPLRGEDDRQALIEALASGLVDIVVSAHAPAPAEDKRLPFDEAAPGAVGLETLLPALLSPAPRRPRAAAPPDRGRHPRARQGRSASPPAAWPSARRPTWCSATSTRPRVIDADAADLQVQELRLRRPPPAGRRC